MDEAIHASKGSCNSFGPHSSDCPLLVCGYHHAAERKDSFLDSFHILTSQH